MKKITAFFPGLFLTVGLTTCEQQSDKAPPVQYDIQKTGMKTYKNYFKKKLIWFFISLTVMLVILFFLNQFMWDNNAMIRSGLL